MNVKGIIESIPDATERKLKRMIINPLNEITDEGISSIVTTIGSFVIKSIRGKFSRSISFSVGSIHSDSWMEESLYEILSKYNNIKKKGNLELAKYQQSNSYSSEIYYRLAEGIHDLKYKDFNILLCIQEETNVANNTGRSQQRRNYQIITYNLDPSFVTSFEKDMASQRNRLLKIDKESPKIKVFQDCHESDGYTYWSIEPPIWRRKFDTLYIPRDQKKLIIDTVNRFFASKEEYKRHGRAHNLKILLHGPAGTGKDTIARIVASEWNRNLYYIKGGKGGKFIPDAIESNDNIISPLMLISDIDKYPFLINDTDISTDKEDNKIEEKMGYKQSFGHMLNALDGIGSMDGRIIIMTTNYIEKFSPVFLRPGRIDLSMNISYTTIEVFRKYTYDFYKVLLPENIKLKNEKITIADLQFDIMFLRLTADEFVKKYCK